MKLKENNIQKLADLFTSVHPACPMMALCNFGIELWPDKSEDEIVNEIVSVVGTLETKRMLHDWSDFIEAQPN